jgi:hypothetical protein
MRRCAEARTAFGIMSLRQTAAPLGYGYYPESGQGAEAILVLERGLSPSCPVGQPSAAVAPESEPMRPSRYVLPNRIAREFGLSRSDVQRALVGEARKQ